MTDELTDLSRRAYAEAVDASAAADAVARAAQLAQVAVEADAGHVDTDELDDRQDEVDALRSMASALDADRADALEWLRDLELARLAELPAASIEEARRSAVEEAAGPRVDDVGRDALAARAQAAELAMRGVLPDPDVGRFDDAPAPVGASDGVVLGGPVAPATAPPAAPPAPAVVAPPRPVTGATTPPKRRRFSMSKPKPIELVVGGLAAALVVAGLLVLGDTDDDAPSLLATTATTDTTVVLEAATTATTAATETPTPQLDITRTAAACPSLREGDLGEFTPFAAGTGRAEDPRTHAPNVPWVLVQWNDLDKPLTERAPFTAVAFITESGRTPPATGPVVDREGTAQLWFDWNGTDRHKGVRRFDGTTWLMDLDSDDLTVVYSSKGIAFFWSEMAPGARYEMFLAANGGCASISTDPSGAPAPVA